MKMRFPLCSKTIAHKSIGLCWAQTSRQLPTLFFPEHSVPDSPIRLKGIVVAAAKRPIDVKESIFELKSQMGRVLKVKLCIIGYDRIKARWWSRCNHRHKCIGITICE
jgi:hypothetical protein